MKKKLNWRQGENNSFFLFGVVENCRLQIDIGLIIIFSFLYLLYPLYTVYAYIPAPPQVIFECDDRHVAFFLSTDGSEISSKIDTNCLNDIGNVIPVFEQTYQRWAENHRYLLDGNLIFTPYSIEKVAHLTQENRNLLQCHYKKFKSVEDWLIIAETIREYCYEAQGMLGTISDTVIAPLPFFVYIFRNLNFQTLPYLLLIGFLFSLLVYVARKGELAKALQLNLLS
ncbi:MAG: hypothetical protein AAF485_29770, partial [Chloroflexota bacterium]